jgi:NAD(P)-dependent dehydrogenase (short-subunit alcohol dehydrogenase family)
MSASSAQRRVCLLTGAGGRLGSDFCRRYGASYDIAAVCRRRRPDVADQDRRYVDPLRPDGPDEDVEVFTIDADLRRPGEAERVVDLALAHFGRVDLLVNAAAHVERERLTTLCESTSFLDDAMYVNATVPALLASSLARAFWDGRRAENVEQRRNVVNVSSGAGLGYVDSPGLAAYSASKVALNFLTCYQAAELRGMGVRVNAVAPTTFPELVPTEQVSDQIVAVDAGDLTGQIVELL